MLSTSLPAGCTVFRYMCSSARVEAREVASGVSRRAVLVFSLQRNASVFLEMKTSSATEGKKIGAWPRGVLTFN